MAVPMLVMSQLTLILCYILIDYVTQFIDMHLDRVASAVPGGQ